MIQEITPEQAQKSLVDSLEQIVLDVRTTGEFGRNRIKGAINLPVDELLKKVETIITDKTKRVLVYCLSGARSEAAVEAMVQMGYTNVFSMTGGLLVWRLKQFPLEN